MRAIMAGEASPGQIGGFLMALRTKGETADELEGLATTMLEFATPVRSPVPVADVVGTGGDRSGTFNISTVSAIVVAGAGVPVAKHGNRAASSHCGSADVLEALGVKIDLDAARCRALPDRGRDRLPVRAGVPPVDGPRRPGPPRTPRPDGLQLPRPAHEPGPALRPGDRLQRCPHAPADGRGPRPPRHPRQALPRRGRPRRTDHHRPLDRLRRPRRPGPRDPPRPHRPSASPAPPSTTSKAATPRPRPRSPARSSPGSPAPNATSSSSTPPPPWKPPRRPPPSKTASRSPRRASTPAPPKPNWTPGSQPATPEARRRHTVCAVRRQGGVRRARRRAKPLGEFRRRDVRQVLSASSARRTPTTQ